MSARERLADENPDALWPDGFERAFIGIMRRPGIPALATFSVAKAIVLLMERDGMSAEEAEEYLSFNVVGAWMGPGTPVWIDDLEDEDEGDEDEPFLVPEDLPSGQEATCPAPVTTIPAASTAGATPRGTAVSIRGSTVLAGSTSSASVGGTCSLP